MNDKKQLAAMGAQYRLTEEQAKGLAERMPQTGALQVIDDEPLCMAKRIEELESKYKAAMDVVRDLVEMPYSTGGLMERLEVRERARDLLAGKLPDHIADISNMVAPEGWQLVPVVPTTEMVEAYFAGKIEAQSCTHQQRARERVARDYRAMLAAAPKPEAK